MTTTIERDIAEVIELHKAGTQLADKIKEPIVQLQDHLNRLEDAANDGIPAMLEALENLRYSASESEELRAAVLREHREYHAEASPRFCSSEACRLADGRA